MRHNVFGEIPIVQLRGLEREPIVRSAWTSYDLFCLPLRRNVAGLGLSVRGSGFSLSRVCGSAWQRVSSLAGSFRLSSFVGGELVLRILREGTAGI